MTSQRTTTIGTAFALGTAVGATAVAGRSLATLVRASAGHPWRHRVLDLGAKILQRKFPVEAMSTYLDGIHMYADETGRQVEAAHFCTHLEHDFHQCVIFDRNGPGARLIGIEYIISAERFRALPAEEQQLWHSHDYEVTSGLLTAPGVPGFAERAYFRDLVSTYGKTFHTWEVNRDDFPYGLPKLMMGFTADGQARDELVAARDRRIGVSTAKNRRRRRRIAAPEVNPRANAWESGRVVQIGAREVSVSGLDLEATGIRADAASGKDG